MSEVPLYLALQEKGGPREEVLRTGPNLTGVNERPNETGVNNLMYMQEKGGSREEVLRTGAWRSAEPNAAHQALVDFEQVTVTSCPVKRLVVKQLRVYRGDSLIRNTHPPRTTIGS